MAYSNGGVFHQLAWDTGAKSLCHITKQEPGQMFPIQMISLFSQKRVLYMTAIAASVLGQAFGLAIGIQPARAQLAGHQVSYEMRLLRADPDAKIAGIEGRTAFQLTKECSGWTSLEEYLLRFEYSEGEDIVLASHFESWEQSDGRLYSFEVQEQSSFEEETTIDGFARLVGVEGAARAFFSGNETLELSLPDEIMFPVSHTEALLEAARNGQKILSAFVFVGSDPEQAVHRTNAVIGPKKPNPDRALAGAVGLDWYWPVQVAYFDPAAEQPEPDYEIRFHLQENGLVTYYEVDYGDFSLAANMRAASALNGPDC
jgi:hypothetical protein